MLHVFDQKYGQTNTVGKNDNLKYLLYFKYSKI